MESIAACRVCGQLQRLDELPSGAVGACCRCGARLGVTASQADLGAIAALTLAALILYLPANMLPILTMDLHGVHSETTIWDGCANLFRDGEWFVASIVFLASILIPLLKLLGLAYLIATAGNRSVQRQRERTLILRTIAAVGTWAMLDVFLMAVLVALVKLEQLATIRPGPGLPAFAAVVVLTILASSRFDAALIWPGHQPAQAHVETR
jgi:paraquat-inducible protein A